MSPDDLRSLIDRVATALGPDATPDRVESIARAVLSARDGFSPEGRAPSPVVGDGPISGRILVTAYGCDRPGVLAAITGELHALGVNVLDVSQKILQDYFTLILLADVTGSGATPGRVRERLTPHAERLGVEVRVQHEEIFQAMHRP